MAMYLLPDRLKQRAKQDPLPKEQAVLSLIAFATGAYHGFATGQGTPVPGIARTGLIAGPSLLEGIVGACGKGLAGMSVKRWAEYNASDECLLEAVERTRRPLGFMLGTVYGGLAMGIGFGLGYAAGWLSTAGAR